MPITAINYMGYSFYCPEFITMRNRLIFTFMLLLLHQVGWAQTSSQGNSKASQKSIKPNRAAVISPCEEASNYIPYIPEHHPIKTLRLAFHIFQKNDGSGNFQDTPEDRAILQGFIDEVNRRYAHLDPHDPPVSSQHIADSRIRFRLEKIYFHRDSLAWNMDDDGPCGPYWPCGLKLYKQYVVENQQLSEDEKEKVLHIFLGEAPGYRFATGGAASGIGSKRYIRSRGYYWYYQQHPHLDWARDYIPGNIAHELGHCLGLTHIFEGGYCTRIGDPPQPAKNRANPSNNLLDYGPWRSLTACQLGQMHHAIFQDKGKLRDIWVKDYLARHPQEKVVIKSGEEVVWNSPRYLKGDIVVEKGAKLVIRCQVGMPPDSEVHIEEGGWLLIDNGGQLYGTENSTWKGVKAERAGVWFKFFRRNGAPRNFGLLQIAEGGALLINSGN